MKVFLLVLLFFSVPIFSQNNIKNLYNAFDEVVGVKNTDLSYGKLFYEKYRTLEDNNQYYQKNEFVKGTVSYQNQIFYDVFLKYDVAEDNLIINLPSTFENRTIVLENFYLSEFIIQNSRFLNLQKQGFHELLFSSEKLTLFKKWVKLKQKKLNKSFVYYQFIEKNFYSILVNDNYFEVSNKKDFIKIFPNQKILILSFYKSNKVLEKENLDAFYLQLSEKISSNFINK
jgi:hypothetical protein